MDRYTGKKLDGRYEIHEMIGMGGMAVVYRAYDTIDDRTVAIKILKDEFLGNEEFIRRFKNESKAIAVLSHPNIVKVYDVSFGDRIQYIVMEYIDGITLKEYLDQQKVVKWKEAVHFTVQILRALQHAHEKGIVHRDIKPQNIMLLQDGTIKVTDFGIARFSRNETRTMTEKAIGSVHYIAPEQARGDITDERADIYSVGVMLYEMLTGKLPFEADNAVSVAIMQLQSEPKPPREINPSIPEGLEEITLKAMRKETSQRYQSAAEMLNAIEQFRRNPTIRFQYKYFVDEKPTKYIDAIDNVKSMVPMPESGYDDNYAYEEEEAAAKPAKSPVVHILAGVGIAVVLVAIILLIIGFTRSCQTETVGDTEIPNFVGLMYDDVVNNEEYKFQFEKQLDHDETKPEGMILAQDPQSSTKKYKENAKVILTVNSNEVTTQVPDVTSRTEEEAVNMIKDADLEPEVERIANDNTAAGVVITTNPEPESTVNINTKVTIYVSQGPSEKTVKVPQVINDSYEEAKKKIIAAGLKVANDPIRKDSDKPKDTVLECDPMEFVEVEEGTTVQLTISSGNKPEIEKEIHVQLPTEIDYEVSFVVIVDGEARPAKMLVPKYKDVETVKVTGRNGKKNVVIKIEGQEYWSYTVDFDSGEIVDSRQNPNFHLDSGSSSSSHPSPSGGDNATSSSSQENSSGREED